MWTDPQWPWLLTARLIDPGTVALLVVVIVASFTWIAKWVRAGARPVLLIEEGWVDGAALRRCGLTDEQVHEALERQGLNAFAEVERAWVDHDGLITISPRRALLA